MPDIDLDAIEAHWLGDIDATDPYQALLDMRADLAALLAELRATTADLAVAVEVARERKERIRTQMQVIGEQEDQIVALTEVAEAAQEHVAAEKDTDLPRIGRAHDAMESALDAWRAGGGA